MSFPPSPPSTRGWSKTYGCTQPRCRPQPQGQTGAQNRRPLYQDLVYQEAATHMSTEAPEICDCTIQPIGHDQLDTIGSAPRSVCDFPSRVICIADSFNWLVAQCLQFCDYLD